MKTYTLSASVIMSLLLAAWEPAHATEAAWKSKVEDVRTIQALGGSIEVRMVEEGRNPDGSTNHLLDQFELQVKYTDSPFRHPSPLSGYRFTTASLMRSLAGNDTLRLRAWLGYVAANVTIYHFIDQAIAKWGARRGMDLGRLWAILPTGIITWTIRLYVLPESDPDVIAANGRAAERLLLKKDPKLLLVGESIFEVEKKLQAVLMQP
jgi:hypothetical protein